MKRSVGSVHNLHAVRHADGDRRPRAVSLPEVGREKQQQTRHEKKNFSVFLAERSFAKQLSGNKSCAVNIRKEYLSIFLGEKLCLMEFFPWHNCQ